MGLPFAAWDGHFAAVGPTRSPDKIIRELEATLFAQQLAVSRDMSPMRAVLCTRRAGKTHAVAIRRLVDMERYPGNNSWTGYATLTKGQSRQNLDGPLRELIAQFGLPVTASEPDGQLVFQHANGHRLWVGGVDDLRKSERRRGNKWYGFELDEGGAWPHDVMQYFVDSILEPALSDTGGSLTINGTPGVLLSGYFYEITTPGNTLPDGRAKMPQWPTHKWSVTDNPHHKFGGPDGPAMLEAYRIRKGWDVDNPTWLREWQGEWSIDPSGLIYSYDGQRNALHELPKGELRWVLGIDLGHKDDTAFVLTCSIKGQPHVYVVRAWGAPGMTQPQRAQEILRIQAALQERYGARATVAVDRGGLGADIANDLLKTYGVMSQGAEKYDKGAAIRVVRDALLAGRVMVCPYAPNPDDPVGLGASQLLSEWSVLPWDDDRKDHRKGYADHCPDALLYAYRVHSPRETWDREPPAPGTREAIDAAQRARKSQVGKRAAIMRDESLSPAQRRAKLRREGLGR